MATPSTNCQCGPIASDPGPCNENFLQTRAAYAEVITAPQETLPTFFSVNQCGDNPYPNPAKPVIRPETEQKKLFEPPEKPGYLSGALWAPFHDSPEQSGSNFLRLMADEDFEDYKTLGLPLPKSAVNYLSGSKYVVTFKDGTPRMIAAANSFDVRDETSEFKAVLGLYVPPNFKVIFCPEDPSRKAIGDIANRLEYGPGTLLTNTCCQQITWGTPKKTFLQSAAFDKPKPGFSDQPLEAVPADPIISNQCCKKALSALTVIHQAPYLVVVRLQSLHDLLVGACTKGKQVSFGPYNINGVWSPQSAGCDGLITATCAKPTLLMSELEQDICACFIQQEVLNQKYPKLQVPVTCFGTDPKDMSKNCAYNRRSYQTFEMQQNSCSFAQCQQLINQQGSGTGNVQCAGTFTQFKLPDEESITDVSVTPADDEAIITYSTFIPKWLWVMFASSITMLMTFLVSLTFVA